MHIILVPGCMATAKTLNVTPRLLLMAGVGFVSLAFALSFLLAWVGVHFSLPFSSELVVAEKQGQQGQNEKYMRDNVSFMAVKLGEMQAQVMRLNSLGERISKMTGVHPPKAEGNGKDGQGGPLVHLSHPLSADELQRDIDRLAKEVEDRSDVLTAMESQLMEQHIKATLLPTMVPIKADHVGSVFGHRLDPIAGVGAMHEGVDFVADSGTRVIASAGGVVTTAEFHPQYGNMIEIDHGNDFSSRYAHLSKLSVKMGQLVKRGQFIAASGNTGRTTGPHLHFEVRFKGVAQDPARFLRQGSQLALNLPDDSKLVVRPVKLGMAAVAQQNSRVLTRFDAPR